MRFKDSPGRVSADICPPGSQVNVMHASFRIGETKLMASDGRVTSHPEFKGFSLSLSAPNDADAERLFNALGDDGHVQMPLGKTFYVSSFGRVADRFGVSWMIMTEV